MIPRAWEVYPEEMGDFLLFVKTGGFFQRGDHRMIFWGRKRFFLSFFYDYKIKGRSSEHCPALFSFLDSQYSRVCLASNYTFIIQLYNTGPGHQLGSYLNAFNINIREPAIHDIFISNLTILQNNEV